MKKIKYGNKKVKVDGITFDSQKEAKRYRELKMLEYAGEISELQMQKKYELIPAQYAEVETDEVYKIGALKGQRKKKRVCIENAVNYVADFVYKKDSKTVVEDTKGFKTKDYIIKRKLMLYMNGIRVVEV